jgi:hypothetical protein
MKKRLSFIYRYLTASRHFRLWRARWITAQTLMVAGIIAAFWGTMALSGSYTAAPSLAQADLAGAAAMQSGSVLKSLAQEATAQPDAAQDNAAQAAATPEPNLPPTRTPLPAEYLSNSNQTVGITLASVVLVLIVVGGVLLLLPRREENGSA